MGVPYASLIDLFGKVRSWISWGESGFSSRSLEFAMVENVCKICSECELRFTDFCSKFNCRGCGRWLCGSCVRRSGSLIILATAGGPENCCRLEKIIKSCKFCLKASKRYTEKVYPSESPRGSPEPPSTCFDGGKVCDCRIDKQIHDDAHCKAEGGEHNFSSNAIGNDSTFTSSSVHAFPISVCCSPVRSDEETEYYKKQFSPSSEYDHDGSDVETNSISFSHRNHSCRSGGSSPSDSPSRINVSQSRVGHSVHHEKVGDPNSRNVGPFNHDMAVLVKPEGETENMEYTLSCANDTPISGKDNKFKKQLDIERDDQIWFPPPPEDESDDYERNCFEYDDDDDEIGDSEGMFLSSAGVDSLSHGREVHTAEKNEPIKSVIHDHFKALVSQLMQGEGIYLTKEYECEDWLAIICNLAWQAANYVKPDTRKGGSMDPGAYVKIKCVASGRPSQSSLIKGVVCTKNIKHKRMTSQYKHPRLLLLGGSLEYRSAAGDLASFDTLLEKEKNHLRIFLSRIEAHRPNVLLVEKSVSPYVQEYLLTKEISLVLNVKRHLLERIARCSGASIAPVDNISLARLGHCELFRLEKVSEDLGSASQLNKKPLKTLMFFEGCPRRLGCTILLKGSSTDELKKVKHVIQYAVFAAYHLSLETSFLADEGASLPKMTSRPSSTMMEHANTDILIRTASVISGLPQPRISAPVLTEESPGNCMEVGSLVSSVESLHFASALAPVNDGTEDMSEGCIADQISVTASYLGSTTHQDHILWSPGCPNGMVNNLRTESFEATAPAGQLSKELEGNVQLNEYLPAADDHQSILVSHSSCCVTKFAVCERSRLLRIKFYGSFDKPLGRYLCDDLFDPASYCRSCKGSVEAHVQCYTHQQGSLTINVRCLSSHKLPGQQDGKIWMWHRCLQCAHKDGVPPATHRVIMSDAAWGLSFGKFLDLSFSNHATANRVASCGHSLQRDCLRFYGCGNMVACFRYIPIDILSVRLPPSMLESDGDGKQDWLRREAAELERRIETLYMEITDVLDSMEQRCTCLHNGPSDYGNLNKHIVALKNLISRERYDYHLLLQDNEDASPVQKGVDIMELNNLRHSLLITSHVWDYRFYTLDSFLGSLSSAHEASQAASLHAEPSINLPCKGVNSGSGRVENDSDLSQIGESASKMNADLEPNGSENHNDSSSLLMWGEEVIADEKVTMGDETLEGIPSSAADLSAKIDSAWTGMVEQKHHFVHLLSDGPHGGTSQVNPVENLPIRRLKAPTRVYSFDSTMRSREKLHKASLSSSLHLSAASSFHWSGSSEYTVGNPSSGVLRTHSLISPQKAQRSSSILSSPPAYISCASHLAEGARLLLPQAGRNNLVIAVYDDEPTSIVSYALSSKEHEVWVCDKLNDFEGDSGVYNINVEDHTASGITSWPSFGSVDLDYIGYGGYGPEDVSTRVGGLFQSSNKSSHLRVAFEDDSFSAIGKAKFSVTCYFARQFNMLRKKCCPDEVAFVRSLSRCKKWGAQGGKSNVYFAKSMDDRFIIKQVTKTELESFEKFAPQYFTYVTDSLSSGGPTCLAKVLGIYQVCVKNLKGGKETKMDLMVMENLFFKRNISRIYDLKGSSRSRYNSDKTGANQVLLDTNLLEALSTNPIFLGSKAKRSLERAVWNDTSFLASVDVMDYSLLVGVDEESKELVLGIIDFMRQYTWDKHLETWVKASGILGGPKNASPTIISPKQYKRRFRKAMTTYFLTVPDQWSS